MSSEKTRQQFSVMAGAAALIMGGLLIFHLLALHFMGVNLLAENDEFEGVLQTISENKHLYAASGIVEAMAVACLIPIALSFIFIFDQDRAFAIMAAVFLVIGGAILVVAYAHYGNLVGLAMDFQQHRAANPLLFELADNEGDVFQIIQYGGLATIGFALVTFSVLMTRSDYYPAPIAWITFATGLVAFFYTVVPWLFDYGQPMWGFVLGGYMLAREAGLVSATEEEPEAA
jgi:hypothetical protein